MRHFFEQNKFEDYYDKYIHATYTQINKQTNHKKSWKMGERAKR